MKQKFLGSIKAISVVFASFLGPIICSPLIVTAQEWLQTAPRNTLPMFLYSFLRESKFFFLIMGGFLIFLAPIGIIYLLFQRKRNEAAVCFGLALMYLAAYSATPSHKRLWHGRREALICIAEKTGRVITALEKYREDHGVYPESLQNLVPAYLPSEPIPDALGCPSYLYRRAYDDARFRGYELKLEMTIGFMQWDCFVYWPKQDYPDHMYSGSVERIADWAYVHE